MEFINGVFLAKAARVVWRKADAAWGRLYQIENTLRRMTLKPYELHLELTNVCNANCVFCPYQFQTRPPDFMSDDIFHRAVGGFLAHGGGSVGLTPIVGDPLIDPQFIQRVRYLRAQPRIDRIWVTTNGILLDKHGIANVLDSGLSSITISTSGLDEPSYERIYRSKAYTRVRANVTELLRLNQQRAAPLPITIGLRTDRPLAEVMRDPDLREVLQYQPQLDFTWAYTSAGGRITRPLLPAGMRLRTAPPKREACVETYNGPIVLADGRVMSCSCVAALDAESLVIGDLRTQTLQEAWDSAAHHALRASFTNGRLNETCANCDMYRNLELYRTREGRQRAQLNQRRFQGQLVRRKASRAPFGGG
jgi:radical SAM protein with 4Fe4S-binding SPASM domain